MSDEWLLKICSIGTYQVGKTSLIRRYAENKFETDYLPTIGVDITTKRITLNNQKIKLILVDTAGQEAFGKIRQSYYMGSAACIAVYDVTSRESFKELEYWINDFYSGDKDRNVPLSVIGNKVDLETDRKVSTEEGEEFANQNGFLFYECSAKLGGPLIPQIYSDLIQKYLTISGVNP
ncbi:MAG: Rab family GTPase [Candidatus Hermodarchaeota archaeon]